MINQIGRDEHDLGTRLSPDHGSTLKSEAGRLCSKDDATYPNPCFY